MLHTLKKLENFRILMQTENSIRVNFNNLSFYRAEFLKYYTLISIALLIMFIFVIIFKNYAYLYS